MHFLQEGIIDGFECKEVTVCDLAGFLIIADAKNEFITFFNVGVDKRFRKSTSYHSSNAKVIGGHVDGRLCHWLLHRQQFGGRYCQRKEKEFAGC
jgi:hypothetical protein